MEREKNISQADLVGEKKTKITQDYEFIKEIGSGRICRSDTQVRFRRCTKPDTNYPRLPDVSRS